MPAGDIFTWLFVLFGVLVLQDEIKKVFMGIVEFFVMLGD